MPQSRPVETRVESPILSVKTDQSHLVTAQATVVAQRIATTLLQRGHTAELIDAEHTRPTLDLRNFEAVLVGSPVIGSQYRPSVVRFARKYRQQLQRLPTAFFSVGLAVASRTSDGRAQTLKVVEKLIEKLMALE